MAVRTPPFAAIMPSLDTASFNVTNGRWARTRMKKPARSCAAAAAISPVSTAIPAWRNAAIPLPSTRGSGSSTASTTRAMPAAISASAQGGVRP